MTGPFSESQVRVHRDGLSTPWGFRLTGGKDFKLPLTVQRVFVGSPADGVLQRGDVLVAIENHDAPQLLHKEAMDIIKNAGGSISLRIKRFASRARTTSPPPSTFSTPSVPQYIRSRPLDTNSPKPAPPLGKYPTMSALSRLGGGGPMFGADYTHPSHGHGGGGGGGYHPPSQASNGGGMLHRVQQSLDHAVWEPGREAQYEEEEYQPSASVHDLKKTFMSSAPPYQAARARQSRGPGGVKPFRKPEPDLPASMLEPGWSPGRNKPQGMQPGARGMPTRPFPPPVNRPGPHQDHHGGGGGGGGHRPAQYEVPHVADEPSAWMGTLSSSGAPRPWEVHSQQNMIPGEHRAVPHGRERPRQRPAPAPVAHRTPPAQHSPVGAVPHQPRVQNVHYGPGGGHTIQQHDADTHQGDAKVAHLQYNTPIGLYSKQNVRDTLDQQTRGKAGQGTMQVTGPGQKTYNPAQSSVYALIAEEEGRKQKPRGYALRQDSGGHQAPAESARYHDQGGEMQYEGYQDHSRQSRTMHALEAHMQADAEGTSDF